MGNFLATLIDDDARYLESGELAGGRIIHIGFLLKWGVINAGIATVARASNVATVTTNATHGMIVGQIVAVNATTDNTFDASAAVVASVPSTTSFTYSSTGSDKAQTADSGTLTTWEVVADSTHASLRNCRLQSITTSAITVTWDALPATGTWKVCDGTFGNHQNNASGSFIPVHTGLGLTTAGIALRFRRTLFGRAYWNGTTTGGGVTSNNNWVKEGDTVSASFDSGQNAMFIGHSGVNLPTSGSRGASSWPLPVLQATGGLIVPALPNYQVSPFTAAAYRPSTSGFYCRLYSYAGTLLDQTALQAISPTTGVQFMWTRNCDTLLQDHTVPPFAVTVYAAINIIRVD